MNEVVDALRELIEPVDPVDSTVSLSGTKLDRSCSAPQDYAEETLYGWVEAATQRSIGTGEVQEDFEVVFVYSVGNQGEAAGQPRSRDVSDTLDAKREAWVRLVRLAQSRDGLWGQLVPSSDEDFLRQLALRGLMLRVVGWRVVTGS